MPKATFDDFLARVETKGIASPTTLQGCTDAEINALELRYGVTLPTSYRLYLSTMGKNSGRLLTHDHYAATYEHVFRLTGEYNEDCAEFADEPHVTLPADALVIVGRLGEQFMMIRCSSPDDSPVWYFNDYDAEIKEAYPSVLDWLFDLADEAGDAIRSGYYKMFPGGTRP